MAFRTSMTAIVEVVRVLVNDPHDTAAMFSDLVIQDVLDQYATVAVYEVLTPVENITSDGTMQYKMFTSVHTYWEEFTTSGSVVDGDYDVLSPATSNYQTGVWTFSATQNLPVLVYGTFYDINGAAAELWERKASKYADRFDFTADGSSYTRSQLVKHALDMASKYRGQSPRSQGTGYLTRSDVMQ